MTKKKRCDNVQTTNTPCLKKVGHLFFEYLCETLADFSNFWHATSWKNLT